MNSINRFFRRLRRVILPGRPESEMAEEMRFHLEQRTADYVESGMLPREAAFAAQRKFGNVGSLQEQARDVRGWGALERLRKDARSACRELARHRGFTAVAVITLGLGIGANTSMFSILNHLLLKPLPYSNPDQLDRLFRATPHNPDGHFSAADFLDFKLAADGYGDVAAYALAHASLADAGQPPEMAYVARSTSNLFALLRTAPQFGRDFQQVEATPGRDRVAILSQRTWRNRFGSDPNVIGRTIRLDGEPHEIVGVMPQAFNDWRHLGVVDIFRPLAFTPEEAADRQKTYLRILGRRAADRPQTETAAAVESFGRQQAAKYPDQNADATWRVIPLRINTAGKSGLTVVPMLVGLSGFVLLIACCNLANLLLARTMAQTRELAVRAALGASRLQLLRPLAIESLLLAFAGGALALLVALWFRDWGAVQSTGDNGERVDFAVDWHVASWAFGASVITAVTFGIAPALFALRLDLNQALKSGGRGATLTREHQRFGRILIIGQFALAMVLLTGAGLFIRGLYDLNNRRSGWNSDNVITGTILLPSGKYSEPEKIAAFQRLALQRLENLPGVEAASMSAFVPCFDWTDTRKFIVEDHERPQPGREPAAVVNSVSPDYFDTFGTRVVAGRGFTAQDDARSAPVYLLSESAARAFFGSQNPLGRRIAQAGAGTLRWGEVVGIVNDVRSVEAEARSITLQIYQPIAQEPRRHNEIAVRVSGIVATAIVDSIRTTIRGLDPDLPVRRLTDLDRAIIHFNYQLGVLRDVLTGMALLGLGLATIGIYGVVARMMAQRTHEFAIRLALGACLKDLTRLVLGSGVKLALLGSSIGLVGAFAVSRVLSGAFPGMQSNGVPILIAMTLVLVAVALLACWLPARRAGRIDPMLALRAE